MKVKVTMVLEMDDETFTREMGDEMYGLKRKYPHAPTKDLKDLALLKVMKGDQRQLVGCHRFIEYDEVIGFSRIDRE